MNSTQRQADLLKSSRERSLLDQLFIDSRLYYRSKDFKELLDFISRLRNFAPFNALLLHVQKPGLTYAASARDWRERFGRTPKPGARPLLILWPFGPVALVYDVLDTEGADLPEDVESFFARGPIDEAQIRQFAVALDRQGIDLTRIDARDGSAGSIGHDRSPTRGEERTRYRLCLNQNHSAAAQFCTLAHELGHLFLGHLGSNKALKINARCSLDKSQRELEAESVAYLVCARNGVKLKSHVYMADYVRVNPTVDQIDLYLVMWAAGQVEKILGLGAHTVFDQPNPNHGGSR